MAVPSILAATLMYCRGVVSANPSSDCSGVYYGPGQGLPWPDDISSNSMGPAHTYLKWYPLGVCFNSTIYSCTQGQASKTKFDGPGCDSIVSIHTIPYSVCVSDGEQCGYAVVRSCSDEFMVAVDKCFDVSDKSGNMSVINSCTGQGDLASKMYNSKDCSGDMLEHVSYLTELSPPCGSDQVLHCVNATNPVNSTGFSTTGFSAQANAKKQGKWQLTTREETTIIPWAALLGAGGGVLLVTAICAFAYKRSRKSTATTGHVEIVELPVETQE